MGCDATPSKALIIACCLLGIVLSISGCGGGGGGSGGGGGGGGDKGCRADQSQCTKCTAGKCLGCNPNYELNATIVPGGRCLAACMSQPAQPKPGRPGTPFEMNGKAYPEMCIHNDNAHFFGIGDWGGVGEPGHTWTNPGRCVGDGATAVGSTLSNKTEFVSVDASSEGSRPCQDVDHWAQKYVANQMKKQGKVSKPDYVINVGDNFYPGGVTSTCGTGGNTPGKDPTGQWKAQFDDVYGGTEGLDGKPWFSVLGNHDYGGYTWDLGWDQQIFATWERDNWIMPGQFWSRKVQYEDFAVNYFFLESNFVDTLDKQPSHYICQKAPDHTCWGVTEQTCSGMLMKAWLDGKTMMETALKKDSEEKKDAEWNIIVTHFPPPTVFADPVVQSLNTNYGIDLIITGHTHWQQTGVDATSGIPWIITGGGGGITTDSAPDPHGGHDDAYGFVDFTIDRTTLKFDMYTWGGLPYPTPAHKPNEAPPQSNVQMISKGSHTITSHKSRKKTTSHKETLQATVV